MLHYGAARCRLPDSSPRRSRPPRASSTPPRSACRAFPATRCRSPRFAARHWVADVIYTPIETELIKAARAAGARALTGGGMCVHQAAETFRLFTGLQPDVARMHRTFAAALAERERQAAAIAERLTIGEEPSHEDVDCHGLPERRPRREARRHRRRRLQGRRDLRERPALLRRHASRRAQAGRRSRARDRRLPAVPRFRGHAGRQARARVRARRAQVRPDAGARLRSPAGVLERLAGKPRRHRSRRSRPPRAGRAGDEARPAHRLRGAGLGPPHQRLPRRLGGGAPRRPCRHRPGARQLPHALARKTDLKAMALDPARPHLPGAGRRRARARHGPAIVEPALPQFPGPGRSARCSTS